MTTFQELLKEFNYTKCFGSHFDDYINDHTYLPDSPQQFVDLIGACTDASQMYHGDYVEQVLHTAATIITPAEGFKAKPYLDRLANRPVWTVGYGSTYWHGVVVEEFYPKSVTKTQAVDQLCLDCEWALNAVQSHVIVDLNINQLAALTSFVYNEGTGEKGEKDGFAVLKSGEPSTLLKLINAREFDKVPDELMQWDISDGKVLPGLKIRRLKEATLFMKPIVKGTNNEFV